MDKKRPRKVRVPRYFVPPRVRKQAKGSKPKLASARVIGRQSLSILLHNKKFFGLYCLLYAVLNFLFIQGAGGANILQAKEIAGTALGGSLPTSLIIYGELVGSGAQLTDQVAIMSQIVIILILGLAAIYGLRTMYGEQAQKVSLKEALYKGMTPLIPVLVVLFVLLLEVIPLSIGSSLYATVTANSLVVGNAERLLWLAILVVLAAVSVYLIVTSIMALFIVTLPDMTPIRALKASRELVRFRRWSVLARLVVLPIVLLLVGGLLLVPLIIWLPIVGQAAFFMLSVLVLPVVLTYLYSLYRSLMQ